MVVIKILGILMAIFIAFCLLIFAMGGCGNPQGVWG